jgi:hypothetical protein
MKKPKVVADLLTVTDVCIEASEARARILESCGKGPSKKKSDDLEINMTDRGDSGDHRDCRDRGYRGNRQRQPTDQKEKRHFCHPADAEKWCEIHHTNRPERVQDFSGSQEDATTSISGPRTPSRQASPSRS